VNAAAVMHPTARAKCRVFPGSREQIRHARGFAERVLAGCPAAADAALLVSEIATNAVLHTSSGKGGAFTVVIWRSDYRVEVEVRDGGSAAAPVMRPRTGTSESGFGLGLVDALASRWGHEGNENGRVVWFELEWP
jgi:anti-sigma regulatory factor (Ser/Thr protein kinase)